MAKNLYMDSHPGKKKCPTNCWDYLILSILSYLSYISYLNISKTI